MPVSDGLSGGIVGINRNQLGQGNCHGPPLPADHHEHVGGARIFRCHALIYTAAPDSEGTLGGLVTLGEMANLEQHLDQALECLEICSSDPLCAETTPEHAFMSLHGAASSRANGDLLVAAGEQEEIRPFFAFALARAALGEPTPTFRK